MRPLTDSVPKPLLCVRGQPLIERHVVALVQSGMSRIVITWPGSVAQIRDFLGDGSRYGAAIHYSDEAPHALETAGGIFNALSLLTPRPFAVVNGDIFTDFPFGELRLQTAVTRTWCWYPTRRSTRQAISAWLQAWRSPRL